MASNKSELKLNPEQKQFNLLSEKFMTNKNKSNNNEKPFKNKLKNNFKNIIFPIKLHITIFFIFSITPLIIAQENPSYVTLVFLDTGYFQFLGSDFNNLPDKLYINNIEQDSSTWNTKFVNITNI